MEFDAPILFEDAIAKLGERGIVAIDLDSYQWRMVSAAVRERAFFSSRVESARLLQAMRDALGDWLAASRTEDGRLVAQGRAEFVANMRELAIREGLGKVDPITGAIIPEINESDLSDIRSISRLQLIFDTQTESAQEYGYWKQGLDPDVLAAFPAQRFIRIRPVMVPRPYHAANEGEVRLKSDLKFWLSMNRDFGVPWGPWGFNSGMGVEDVDRAEAEELGLLRPGERVSVSEADFNEALQAGVEGMDPGLLAALRRATGGTVADGRLMARERVAERVFPRAGRLTPETVENSLSKLARHDGTAFAAKADIRRLPQSAQATVEAALLQLGAILPPELVKRLPSTTITFSSAKDMDGVAGKYHPRTGRIRLNSLLEKDPAQLVATVVHENGHRLWSAMPERNRRMILEHFHARVDGETSFQHKGRAYFRDKWADELAGLEDGTEVLPYHLELLALSPARLASRLRDGKVRETLELILAALGIIP